MKQGLKCTERYLSYLNITKKYPIITMKTIETIEDLNTVLKESSMAPVVLFKHSNTCPISAGAYSKITKGIEDGILKADVYMLIVQKSRELSNYIQEKFDIQHESPQVIVVYKNEAIWNTSHNSIGAESINEVTVKLI